MAKSWDCSWTWTNTRKTAVLLEDEIFSLLNMVGDFTYISAGPLNFLLLEDNSCFYSESPTRCRKEEQKKYQNLIHEKVQKKDSADCLNRKHLDGVMY